MAYLLVAFKSASGGITVVSPSNPLPVTGGGGGGGGGGATVTATAAAPTYTEGQTDAALSADLAGNLRVRDDLLKGIVGAASDAVGANTLIGQLKELNDTGGSVSDAAWGGAGNATDNALLKAIAQAALSVAPTVVTAPTPSATTGQIANAASLSAAIEIKGKLVGLKTPAAWTTAVLTFDGSCDGGVTYAPIYDDGTERTIASASIGATRHLSLDLNDWLAYTHIKLRSGTAAAPVNQGGARDFQLALAG